MGNCGYLTVQTKLSSNNKFPNSARRQYDAFDHQNANCTKMKFIEVSLCLYSILFTMSKKPMTYTFGKLGIFLINKICKIGHTTTISVECIDTKVKTRHQHQLIYSFPTYKFLSFDQRIYLHKIFMYFLYILNSMSGV